VYKWVKSAASVFNLDMIEVIRGASVSFLFRGIGAVSQFVFTIMLARMFGVEGLGIYVMALSLSVVASNIGRWGLDQAALKFIAIHADKGEWDKLKGVFAKSIISVLVLSALVSLLFYLLAPWLSMSVFGDESLLQVLEIMIFSIAPFSLLNLIAESLRALKKVGEFTFLQGLLLPLLSISMLVVFYYLDEGLEGASYAYVTACFLSLSVAYILWKRSVNKYLVREALTCDYKALFASATPMAFITITSAFMGFLETFLLGYFYDSSDVGLYSAALRLVLWVNFFIMAFNSILAPKFAALKNSRSIRAMYDLSIRSTTIILLLTSPIFTVYFLFPEAGLRLFGNEFVEAIDVLRILALGQLINIYAGPLGILFLMTNNERIMRNNVFIYAIAGVVSGLILIPTFGAVGAAWGFVIGLLFLNVSYYISIKKILLIEERLPI
jgi:O-antigen/teichoic acid export membrane protein